MGGISSAGMAILRPCGVKEKCPWNAMNLRASKMKIFQGGEKVRDDEMEQQQAG